MHVMCLILFAHKVNKQFPLVVAANRDEFFERPTEQANFWISPATGQRILSGRDLTAGGTWLGISESGRFAAVTNIRDPSVQETKPRSRGALTVDFLQGTMPARDYAQSLHEIQQEFAGFNLLLGDENSLIYINNVEGVEKEVAPGIHGLSNGLLNSDWPKVTQGRAQLQKILEMDSKPDSDRLLEIMRNPTQAEDSQLPDTGLPTQLERELSAAFIHNTERNYGTRCSTAIVVNAQHHCLFSEQNFNSKGQATKSHCYQFKLL